MPDFKKKKNILHIVQWVVALIIGGLIADLVCFECGKHYIKNQFIDASVYGYVIVSSLLFLALLVDEDITQKVGLAICGLGGFLFLGTSIVLVLFFDKYAEMYDDSFYYRSLLAMIFSFVLCILYLVEFFILLIKKSLLE